MRIYSFDLRYLLELSLQHVDLAVVHVQGVVFGGAWLLHRTGCFNYIIEYASSAGEVPNHRNHQLQLVLVAYELGLDLLALGAILEMLVQVEILGLQHHGLLGDV